MMSLKKPMSLEKKLSICHFITFILLACGSALVFTNHQVLIEELKRECTVNQAEQTVFYSRDENEGFSLGDIIEHRQVVFRLGVNNNTEAKNQTNTNELEQNIAFYMCNGEADCQVFLDNYMKYKKPTECFLGCDKKNLYLEYSECDAGWICFILISWFTFVISLLLSSIIWCG